VISCGDTPEFELGTEECHENPVRIADISVTSRNVTGERASYFTTGGLPPIILS
jgi:hypothetical protein